MADKVVIAAQFEFTMNEKRQIQDAAKALIGERRKFGELWRDFLDGDADAEQTFVWWWAVHDGHPDLTVEQVGEWGPSDYEVKLVEESEGEESAVENGGSTTRPRSSRSSSSTKAESDLQTSTTGTPTS